MRKCPKCNWAADGEQMYCMNCGTKLVENPIQNDTGTREQKTKKKVLIWRIISIVLFVLLVLMAIVAATAASEADYYDEKYFDIQGDYYNLLDEKEELQKQVDFMNEYVVIVDANSESELYHTYSCESWNWDDDWSIRIYNVSAAEYEGYSPCPECH